MIDNGFTPEWIQLSKEIREEIEELKTRLLDIRNDIGEIPLTPKDEAVWQNNLEKLKILTKQINNKIDKYNLLVPILQKQMLHIQLHEHAEKALSMPPKRNKKCASINHKKSNESISQDLFSFISDLFNKKIS